MPELLACSTQGSDSNDEHRLRALLAAFETEFLAFDRTQKRNSAVKLLRILQRRQFPLLVIEGAGIGAGLPAILGKLLFGTRYVVSNGDSIAPFQAAGHPWMEPVFSLYEKLLYRHSAGFIGWTPYLVGRALTYGAPRAITVPGWAPYDAAPSRSEARQRIRARHGIPDDAIVFGIIGSLQWSERYGYCYGSELVRAATRRPTSAYVLVLGGGTGLDRLRRFAGDSLDSNIFLPGPISREDVPEYLAAMDVGSIPQSVDGVGNFRYTTKISEYMAAGLPFITNQIPMAYDLDHGNLWRLPGTSPWDGIFIDALADLMATLTTEELEQHTAAAGRQLEIFDKDSQIKRATAFLKDILRG